MIRNPRISRLIAIWNRLGFVCLAQGLVGRALAINAVIADMMKEAIKNGIEAIEPPATDEELERAGAEAALILDRLGQADSQETLDRANAPVRPPQADWRAS